MSPLRSAAILLALVFVNAQAATTLPVTQTWAQLKAAPEIDITTPAGPAKARVGIEQSRAIKGRTVAIYALVEGPLVKPFQNEDYDNQLGPLVVDAKRLDVISAHDVIKMKQDRELKKEAKPFQLYAMLIPFNAAGTFQIGVHLPRAPFLAETELLSEPGWSHPWTRLRLPAFGEADKEEQPAGEFRANAVYADWESAYPRLDGSTPIQMFTAAELSAMNGPLPRLEGTRRTLPLPDFAGAAKLKDDPAAVARLISQLGLADFEVREHATALLHALLPSAAKELKAARFATVDAEARSRLESLLEAADAYTLKFHAEQELWTLDFPAPREYSRFSSLDKILVRWWINGKPVVKESPEEKKPEMRNGAEQVERASLWKIDLHADYAWLGAHSGDAVSVQILYAPCGIKEFGDFDEAISGIDCESTIQPLLSNISTFIYKRMQP